MGKTIAEKIIKLEGEWTLIDEEIKLQEPMHKNHMFIKSVLKADEVKAVEEIITTLNTNREKSGFLAGLKNSSSIGKLKKILKLSSFEVTSENLMTLTAELEYAKLVCFYTLRNARILYVV